MITLGNTLKPADIRLELESRDVHGATVELANLLRHDKRVTDWSRFLAVLEKQKLCIAGEKTATFCLPHARTDAVHSLVMAAGRSTEGLRMPNSDQRCHYLFVVGIPSAMDAEYLRLIGALARIFRDSSAEQTLWKTETAADFHEVLSAAEISL